MRNQFISLVAFLALATSVEVRAENWAVFAVDDQAENQIMTSFIELDSHKCSDSMCKIWVARATYPADKNGINLSKVLFQIDCIDDRYRVLSTTTYKYETPINSSNTPSDWEYMIPGSYGETIAKLACGRMDKNEIIEINKLSKEFLKEYEEELENEYLKQKNK